jgi:hypothetical protein
MQPNMPKVVETSQRIFGVTSLLDAKCNRQKKSQLTCRATDTEWTHNC